MSDCLHCDINDLVKQHLDKGEDADIADVAARMVESLVDLVLVAPDGDHASLMADVLAQFGHVYLERSAAVADGESSARH